MPGITSPVGHHDFGLFMFFDLNGWRIPLFVSTLNCGFPPERMTERSVELAIANVLLDLEPRDLVLEIGAVTPYYWPHRIKDICDPIDTHRLINIRASMLDINLHGRIVLSISTMEHIGKGDYGLPRNLDLNRRAFEKLFSESARFLITVPGGYFPEMDRYLLETIPKVPDCSAYFLLRGPNDNNWREVLQPRIDELTYGKWANSLIIICRDTFIDRPPTS